MNIGLFVKEHASAALIGLAVLGIGTSDAMGWTRTAGFEDGKVGEQAQDTEDSFDGAAGLSKYTTEQVFSGDMASKVQVREGAEGWGTFGGVIDFPENVGRHGEVWVKISVLFPESYEWMPEPHNSKFIRVRTKGPEIGSRYNNIYLDDRRIRYIRSGWKTIRDYGPPRGEWVTYEWYIRFDHVSTDDGGQGKTRFWIDGEPVAEHTDVATLAEKDAEAFALYVFTWYGNLGAPRDLHAYVDDIVITTNATGVDQTGHPYIGVGSPPQSPTVNAQ